MTERINDPFWRANEALPEDLRVKWAAIVSAMRFAPVVGSADAIIERARETERLILKARGASC